MIPVLGQTKHTVNLRYNMGPKNDVNVSKETGDDFEGSPNAQTGVKVNNFSKEQ